MFSFIILNLYDKRMESRYEVTFYNGKSTRFILRKSIAIGACDEIKVQRFIMYLSDVLKVVQYVEL